ncbi:hypothetical protein [Streptomyces decoyicus]|uniref:hypothetical protein n=1 Tax=Streptomyces decoyicus TaxID=249567 RepID=UPI003862F492
MLAAEGFDREEKNTVIAKGLRVSVRSVERWRRSWRDNGVAGLRCSGPAKAREGGPAGVRHARRRATERSCVPRVAGRTVDTVTGKGVDRAHAGNRLVRPWSVGTAAASWLVVPAAGASGRRA